MLPPHKTRQLQIVSPNSPILRRHYAARRSIEEYLPLHRPRAGEVCSPHRIPLALVSIVAHINRHYLILPSDRPLIPLTMWRLLYRIIFGNLQVQPKIPSLSHQAIYVQTRHDKPCEIQLGRQKRMNAMCKNQIGEDFSLLKSNTTIVQEGGHPLMYCVSDLHVRYHGSVDVDALPHRRVIFDFVGIDHSEISHKTAGRAGVGSSDHLFVAFHNSKIFGKLQAKLIPRGGLLRFQHELTKHLLLGGVRDEERMSGTIDNSSPAYNIRCRFGFGRVQRASPDTWYIGSFKMPTLNVKSFNLMSPYLRIQLMTVIESGQQFVSQHFKSSFSNSGRNSMFAGRLNKAMGFPRSIAKFEYYDIVLSRNTILTKHVDHKNDHRIGYNYCVVFSFFHTIDNVEYRVSIVMTTRSTAGCRYDVVKHIV